MTAKIVNHVKSKFILIYLKIGIGTVVLNKVFIFANKTTIEFYTLKYTI